MATRRFGLKNDHGDAAPVDLAFFNGLPEDAELLAELCELVGAGFFAPTDANLSIVAGALAVDVSAYRAIVGDAGWRTPRCLAATTRVTDLDANSTNYIYLVSTCRSLPFADGSTRIVVGNTITGATTGQTATVAAVVVDTGTWSGGNAAGYLYLHSLSGDFGAESLKVGATVVATTTGMPVNTQGRVIETLYAALAHVTAPASAPAHSHLAGTATTNATQVTSVNNASSGRRNLGGLLTEGAGAARDAGSPATGVVSLTSNPNDADTCTVAVTLLSGVVNSSTYEFEVSGGVTAGNIAVTRGATKQDSALNLANAVAANQAAVVTATRHGTDMHVVDLRAVEAGADLAVAENTAGVRIVVQDDANHAAPGALARHFASRTVTAAEVARGRMVFASGLVSLFDVQYDVSGGLFNGSDSVSGGTLELANTGTAHLVAGYIVTVRAWGRP